MFRKILSGLGNQIKDTVQQNNKSVFPYVWDISEAEVIALEEEANKLEGSAYWVGRYSQAVIRKANAVGRIYDANADAEMAVLNLGAQVNKKNKAMQPARRQFKEVEPDLMKAVARVREQRMLPWS